MINLFNNHLEEGICTENHDEILIKLIYFINSNPNILYKTIDILERENFDYEEMQKQNFIEILKDLL